MYLTFEVFTDCGGCVTDQRTFSRLAIRAGRYMENATTGIDGYRKLRNAFPTDELDAQTVRQCETDIINLLHDIETADETARSMNGYVQRDDGTTIGKNIASMSAGNESISYSASAVTASYTAAVTDDSARNKMIADCIKTYLSGVPDANGVNLLYMGEYPYV